eukprot:22114-Eustigmatos_ZCMA.PRE.1
MARLSAHLLKTETKLQTKECSSSRQSDHPRRAAYPPTPSSAAFPRIASPGGNTASPQGPQ